MSSNALCAALMRVDIARLDVIDVMAVKHMPPGEARDIIRLQLSEVRSNLESAATQMEQAAS